MTSQLVIELGRDAITTSLMIMAPILVVGFVIGLSVSFVQAIMQMQEMTLAFVPKIIAISGALVIFGHWMLTKLMTYSVHLLGGFTDLIGH